MKKVLSTILLSFVSLVLLLYVAYSSVRYWRSTFFIYPDIKERYEIVGKIDTPEEALETCRSKFVAKDLDGSNVNFYKIGIWDSKVQFIKRGELRGEKDSHYFQIRVIEGFDNDWVIISSIENPSAKECFFCTNVEFGSKSRTFRCHINADGERLKKK